jgi:hypothetical protein
MDVLMLWVLCSVRLWSLWRADHSPRGDLPTVVRRCVWSRNLVNEEALAHWGVLSRQKRLRIDEWMNEFGEMVQWYGQGKEILSQCHSNTRLTWNCQGTEPWPLLWGTDDELSEPWHGSQTPADNSST